MASAKLINRIKYSHTFYGLYYYLGSFIIKVIKLFVIPENQLILFSSYSGKKYDDSPKDIYEAMLNDKRFSNSKIVWAFKNPSIHKIPRGETVKVDTLAYFIIALKARVWITNVSMTRGLDFKGKNTFYLNTWHGIPIKYVGSDVITKNGGTFISKGKKNAIDIQIAQGDYDKAIYAKAFNVESERVLITGWPRNDSLVYDNNDERIKDLRCSLGIPTGKKVILYAPTYRDYEKDAGNNCVMKPPFDLKKWEKALSKDYILFIRAHQEVVSVLNLEENVFVRNASDFPTLNNLLLVTDILISDYSGILFDYSILGRPMIAYTYDYEQYKNARGMYIDIRKELPYAESEDDLLSIISKIEYSQFSKISVAFREKYIKKYGNSSQRVLDVVYSAIN